MWGAIRRCAAVQEVVPREGNDVNRMEQPRDRGLTSGRPTLERFHVEHEARYATPAVERFTWNSRAAPHHHTRRVATAAGSDSSAVTYLHT
jgi:hypothetical protein